MANSDTPVPAQPSLQELISAQCQVSRLTKELQTAESLVDAERDCTGSQDLPSGRQYSDASRNVASRRSRPSPIVAGLIAARAAAVTAIEHISRDEELITWLSSSLEYDSADGSVLEGSNVLALIAAYERIDSLSF